MVSPGGVLHVSLDVFLGSHGRTGENLGDVDELTLEGITGELDGFVEGSKVGVVVADAGVEVVESNLGHVEGIGGLEGDGAGGVAGVSLQDSPGEPVVLVSGVDAVVGEVAAEVDGATEAEDVEAVIGCNGALVQHGGGETGGGVDAAVAEDGGLPAIDTGVGLVVDAKGAAVESSSILPWTEIS